MKKTERKCWYCGEAMPAKLTDWCVCPKCGCTHEPDWEMLPLIHIPTAGQEATRAASRPR